ncbi:MAG: hypothetical protein K2L98_03995 [Bacilli bacterium]|nr:hypothetical protein [Bacilli bacterium]
MTLEEYIDAIVQVVEELKNESIDYDKIKALNSILGKLIEKYAKKCETGTPWELDSDLFKISTEKSIIKSEKTKETLETLYNITVGNVQDDSLPDYETVEIAEVKRAVM